jgi:hypothetical protein
VTNAHREIVHLDPEMDIGQEFFHVAPFYSADTAASPTPAKVIRPNLGNRILNRFPDWTWFLAGVAIVIVLGLLGLDGVE